MQKTSFFEQNILKMSCNYIPKKQALFVAGLGAVIVVGAIIASMAVAMFMYTQYQTNFIETTAGETFTVGPVEYVITFEGTHEGDKEIGRAHV